MSWSGPSTVESVILDHLKAKHILYLQARDDMNYTFMAICQVQMQVLRDVLGDLGYGDEAITDYLEGNEP